MNAKGNPTLTNRTTYSSRHAVEDAIDLSKADPSCTWLKLLSVKNTEEQYPVGVSPEHIPDNSVCTE